MEEMKNVALSSRLNADELKQVHETAKSNVKAMDFGMYAKRKRKQAWKKLEELKEKQMFRKKKDEEKKKKRDESNMVYELVEPSEEEEVVSETQMMDKASAEPVDNYEFDDLFEEEDTETSFELEETKVGKAIR